MVMHSTAFPAGEIRGHLYFSQVGNNIAAGVYKTGCTTNGRSGFSEDVCIKVDAIGSATWFSGNYFGGGCINLLGTSARMHNFTFANQGINQLLSRQSGKLDMAIFRPRTAYYVQSSSESNPGTCVSVAGCAGYQSGAYKRSMIMQPGCPDTCGPLNTNYGNWYFTSDGSTFIITQIELSRALANTHTARDYYILQKQAAGIECTDLVAAFPGSTGFAVQPSIVVAALAALVAVFRF